MLEWEAVIDKIKGIKDRKCKTVANMSMVDIKREGPPARTKFLVWMS